MSLRASAHTGAAIRIPRPQLIRSRKPFLEKHFFVYILANKTNTTIYTGVTSNLPARIKEHKDHLDPNSFTARYDVTKLVYFEEAGREPFAAFEREKQIKSWNRARKNKLVNSMNPTWEDLYPRLFE